MENVGKAIAGVAASAGVLLGAYGVGELEANREQAEISDCAELFEGKAREDCVEDARDDDNWIPGILAITGVAGIVGCGYLGYKALKEDIGTTGIVEDHL